MSVIVRDEYKNLYWLYDEMPERDPDRIYNDDLVIATGVEARIAEMLIRRVTGVGVQEQVAVDDLDQLYRYAFDLTVDTGKIVGDHVNTKYWSGRRVFYSANICADSARWFSPFKTRTGKGIGGKVIVQMRLQNREGDWWIPETWSLNKLLRAAGNPEAIASQIGQAGQEK